MVEVRITKFSPQSGASNKGGVGKISSVSVNISKTVADAVKVTIGSRWMDGAVFYVPANTV